MVLELLLRYSLSSLMVLGHGGDASRAGSDQIDASPFVAKYKCLGRFAIQRIPRYSLPDDKQLILILPNKRKVVIRSITDLRKLVSITTSAEALQFVRLRTQPRFAWLTDGRRIYEVMPRTSITIEAYYHDREIMELVKAMPLGVAGVVDKAWCKKSGYGGAVVRRVNDGWLINRCLVTEFTDVDHGHTIRVVEHVGKNGEYEVVSRRAVPFKSPSGTWLGLPGLL